VRGAAGAQVRLTPGELLDDKGLVSQRSSGGPTYFTYVLKGAGDETWHPSSLIMGFAMYRLRVTPKWWTCRGNSYRRRCRAPGEISTSSTLFNRIHKLIDARRTQQSAKP